MAGRAESPAVARARCLSGTADASPEGRPEGRPLTLPWQPVVEVRLHSAGAASRHHPNAAAALGTPGSGCVAPRSHIPDMLARRALPAGRITGLGAAPDLHHGLLEPFCGAPGHRGMAEEVGAPRVFGADGRSQRANSRRSGRPGDRDLR